MDIDIDKVLDQYRQSVGLPNEFLISHNEVLPFLSLSAKDIHKLRPEDAGEAGILLNTFGLHIQLKINRETAKNNWAKQQIKKHLCNKLSNYQGSWDNQLLCAIKDDKYAQKLEELTIQTKLRLDELSYITNAIKSLSDALLWRSRNVNRS